MKSPVSADPYDILLGHNRWGNATVLGLCERLSREQFHQPFPIGPAERGGLHATLTHVVSAMLRWSDRLAQRPVRPPIEAARPGFTGPVDYRERTPQELAAIAETAHAALAELKPVVVASPGAIITVAFGDKSYQFTAAAAYIHALTHGHYHRAQCLNMLRQLGVGKLPDVDVVDWQQETECSS
ncbi:MAG: hypothetical protein AMXMBFR58_18390 [Phycisphaerae bacterium]